MKKPYLQKIQSGYFLQLKLSKFFQLKSRIKKNEGYSNQIYYDQVGKPTIGFGHLIKKGEKFLHQKKYSKKYLNNLFENDFSSALSDFYKSYKGLKKAGYPIVSSDIAVEYVDKWPLGGKTTIYKKDLPNIPQDSYYPCSLGRTQCFISADGNVYPCSKRWGYGINIRHGGFQKAWDHLSDLDCVACKELGTIEQSLILGLQIRGLVNGIANFAI